MDRVASGWVLQDSDEPKSRGGHGKSDYVDMTVNGHEIYIQDHENSEVLSFGPKWT